jgi:hypothetical protein
LGGNYPDKSSSSLVSPCYDLSQLQSGNIRFFMGYELETYYDFIYLQYSTNRGENWSTIEGFNGFDGAMKEYNYPVTENMISQNIIFRFHFLSDSRENEEGVVIDDFIVEGTVLGIENEIDLEIAIYPNPTTGRFTIDTNGQFKLEHIKIYSIEGKQVYDNNFFVEHSKKEIDLSNQSKGLYFVELSTSDQRKVIRKLIVE